ncbi:DUF2505 family protein [bacterium]|nr:MAG: DUF2505 family protein [bacterium]
MAQIRVRHEMECSEDTYWNKCVFNDEYNRKLYLEKLGFPRYNQIEMKDLGTSVTRKVDIDPPVAGLPGPVKKVIGDKLSYLEEGTFDKASKRYSFKVTPSTMADKTTVKGVLYTEALGENRCARIVEVEITVKVFMVGSLVEDKISGDLRSSYDAAAQFTNEFVKTH